MFHAFASMLSPSLSLPGLVVHRFAVPLISKNFWKFPPHCCQKRFFRRIEICYKKMEIHQLTTSENIQGMVGRHQYIKYMIFQGYIFFIIIDFFNASQTCKNLDTLSTITIINMKHMLMVVLL